MNVQKWLTLSLLIFGLLVTQVGGAFASVQPACSMDMSMEMGMSSMHKPAADMTMDCCDDMPTPCCEDDCQCAPTALLIALLVNPALLEGTGPAHEAFIARLPRVQPPNLRKPIRPPIPFFS